ncbi:hypothetical protein SXCC_02239 [Gluconacetobacter sp. SXCC-1]|nr:hypothetical protein SXCC_02239 [Gluconacetobacter sp. SXCC-1]SAY48322.1 hypothetical protein KRIGEM_01269 [Komagataeibacter rhaeticus]
MDDRAQCPFPPRLRTDMRVLLFLTRSNMALAVPCALAWWLAGPFFHQPVIGVSLAVEAVIFWVCGLLYTEDYPHHVATFTGMTILLGLLSIGVMLPFVQRQLLLHGA